MLKIKMSFALLLSSILLIGCNSPEEAKTGSSIQPNGKISEKDSLKMLNSSEFKRVKDFLTWYKAGYDSLCFHSIEKYENQIIYVDTAYAWNLLARYRRSGFFTENKLAQDSLYVLNAQHIYETDTTIDMYDHFNYDFFLMTQEAPQVLDCIPQIFLTPEKSELAKGILTVDICKPQLIDITFYLKHEKGKIKVDKIN